MSTLFQSLMSDECGFIVSAELVLVATILVIGMIVGLAEIQSALVAELNDVADAIGSINQSYFFTGFSAEKGYGQVKSKTYGSTFQDIRDECDGNQCELSCDDPEGEGWK
ncbi:hypothetical protein [Thalassoglobus polymorphus]|nr:hypothetical protein [Thalassoglobus polymorphus]